MSCRILVSNLMMIAERSRFERELRQLGFEPIWPKVAQFLSEDECLRLVGAIDGWLAGDDAITRRVLEAAAPRLRVISKWGTGVDSIDLDAAQVLGIPVLNSPGAFADAVAECAIGYLLMLARHLYAVDQQVREGQWPKPCGRSLKGQTLGVIGFGAIGRRIGAMAQGLGMRVIFHDPALKSPIGNAIPATQKMIATRSDAVVLACNLSAENAGMIDRAFLRAMRPDSVLVNVARGPLVRTQPLIEALQNGRIAGAALDVFETEPLPDNSMLRDLPNVILGSHNANNEKSAVEFVHRNSIANLMSALEPTRPLEEAH